MVAIFILACIGVISGMIDSFSDKHDYILITYPICIISGWEVNSVLGVVLCCFLSLMFVIAVIAKLVRG